VTQVVKVADEVLVSKVVDVTAGPGIEATDAEHRGLIRFDRGTTDTHFRN